MPELVRFYGGDPMSWLTTMPMGVVTAHIAMLPRLRVRESVREAHTAAIGACTIKPRERQQLLRDWQREAYPDRPVKRSAATPQQLRHMGIAVVSVSTERHGA